MSLVSAVVVLVNHLNSGLGRMLITLPSLPFQLSIQALGLLLVFKTNASYARWSEGRAAWARVVSHSRNMVRMVATFTDCSDTDGTVAQSQRKQLVQRFAQATWLFNRSLMNYLSPVLEDDYLYFKEVRATVDDTTLIARILVSPNRALAAMTEVSCALYRLESIDEKRRIEVDKSIAVLNECLSTCEKIYSSPIPLVYTRHTDRFLSLWLLLLPAALYEPFCHAKIMASPFWLNIKGLAVIPTVAIVAIFFFGIEELALALEEPFSILPMQAFCNGVKESCSIIVDWCFESADRKQGLRSLEDR